MKAPTRRRQCAGAPEPSLCPFCLSFLSLPTPPPQWGQICGYAQPSGGARSPAVCLKRPLIPILCERTVKAPTRRRQCAGSPEPSLSPFCLPFLSPPPPPPMGPDLRLCPAIQWGQIYGSAQPSSGTRSTALHSHPVGPDLRLCTAIL